MSQIICPYCHNPIDDEDVLLCHFCGNSLSRHSGGLMGRMRSGGMRWIVATIGIMIAIAFVLTMVH